MNEQTDERQASAGQVERPVRPSLLTEKELLGIVDALIRDRAFNRPAAVAIAMAVGAAVEAEVRERCAEKAAPEHIPFSDDEWRVRCEVRDAILGA